METIFSVVRPGNNSLGRRITTQANEHLFGSNYPPANSADPFAALFGKPKPSFGGHKEGIDHVVSIDIPGCTFQDVKVKASPDGGVISIDADRRGQVANFSLQLPRPLSSDAVVTAHVQAGVLTLRLVDYYGEKSLSRIIDVVDGADPRDTPVEPAHTGPTPRNSSQDKKPVIDNNDKPEDKLVPHDKPNDKVVPAKKK